MRPSAFPVSVFVLIVLSALCASAQDKTGATPVPQVLGTKPVQPLYTKLPASADASQTPPAVARFNVNPGQYVEPPPIAPAAPPALPTQMKFDLIRTEVGAAVGTAPVAEGEVSTVRPGALVDTNLSAQAVHPVRVWHRYIDFSDEVPGGMLRIAANPGPYRYSVLELTILPSGGFRGPIVCDITGPDGSHSSRDFQGHPTLPILVVGSARWQEFLVRCSGAWQFNRAVFSRLGR